MSRESPSAGGVGFPGFLESFASDPNLDKDSVFEISGERQRAQRRLSTRITRSGTGFDSATLACSPTHSMYENTYRKHSVEFGEGGAQVLEHQMVSVPKANIFWYVAFEVEKLKHQESLRLQIRKLAKKHEAQILAMLAKTPRSGTDAAPRLSPEAACEEFLTRELLEATVETYSTRRGGGLYDNDQMENDRGMTMCRTTAHGFDAIQYFLNEGSEKPERLFFGLLLVPSDPHQRYIWVKNHAMGIMVGMLKVLGPAMLLICEVIETLERNKEESFGIWDWLPSWGGILCDGYGVALGVKLLGFLFIICNYEITRAHAVEEAEADEKMSSLPGDRSWLLYGIFCNSVCMTVTVLTIPFVFWDNMHPKEIIFNSLSMLFLYHIDKCDGGVLGYLRMGDDDFGQRYRQLLVCLSQCPLNLADVFTMSEDDPTYPVWTLAWDGGLLVANSKERALCECRCEILYQSEGHPLGHRGTSEGSAQSETDPSGTARDIRYAVNPGASCFLKSGRYRLLWVSVLWLLLPQEIIIPLMFLFSEASCDKRVALGGTIYPPANVAAPGGPAPLPPPDVFPRLVSETAYAALRGSAARGQLRSRQRLEPDADV